MAHVVPPVSLPVPQVGAAMDLGGHLRSLTQSLLQKPFFPNKATFTGSGD